MDASSACIVYDWPCPVLAVYPHEVRVNVESVEKGAQSLKHQADNRSSAPINAAVRQYFYLHRTHGMTKRRPANRHFVCARCLFIHGAADGARMTLEERVGGEEPYAAIDRMPSTYVFVLTVTVPCGLRRPNIDEERSRIVSLDLRKVHGICELAEKVELRPTPAYLKPAAKLLHESS